MVVASLCIRYRDGKPGYASQCETELSGLVYGCTALPEQDGYPLVQRPWFWAVVAFFMFLWLQWLFW
jgi:hypothetical protein